MKGVAFYFLCGMYLLLVFGSIYGLFVSELSFKFGENTSFHFTLSGWIKNIVCILGLLVAGFIAAFPILLAIYRALSVD